MSKRQEGRRVAIAGVGLSPTGRRLGMANLKMTALSARAAMEDAGLTNTDIDGVGIYTFQESPTHRNQFTSSVDTAGMLGLPEPRWFMTTTEGPAYLGAAIPAINAVASGQCDVCLTVRTLTHPGSSSGSAYPTTEYGGASQFTFPFGACATAQWCALLWQRHMATYGSTAEQLGYQPVYQREFAALNEAALLRDRITLDDYLNSRYISKPLRLLDCEYPISGSGAVIFTTEERARDLRKPVVLVDSSSLVLARRPDFYQVEDILESAPFFAAKDLWSRTELHPEDVDVGGLYDGFTVITLTWLEALGFCKPGESGAFVEAGHTRMGGSLPINCDGGTLNMGRLHGVNHVIEVTRQLRGESGARQTPNAEVGVATTAIGPFAAALLLTRP
jgi:acetyl-CoA acetyltransferase